MKYVIGIDSGGTNYRVAAADLEGNKLGEYTGAPASHCHVPEEEMKQRISASVDNCLSQFGGNRADVQAIVCGTTGLDSIEDEATLQRIYNSLPGFDCPVRVMNDAELAFHTVTGGRGILLVSGTGSIAVGCDGKGKTVRSGGWPFAIGGDEGSGAWISQMALRQMGRWLDGVIEKSIMIQEISEELNIYTRNDLNRIAFRCAAPPWNLPPLSRLVNQAAEKGDRLAMDILRQAAEHVFHIVEDAAGALRYHASDEFPIGLWGSNILKSEIMTGHFTELVEKQYPNASICFPYRQATDGAIDLALKMLRK